MKSEQLPLVCICIPTYNAAATIRETLESILAQTYPNLVVHVSDNASTDDTLKVVESLASPRITIHRNAENIGGEGNFNRCIQLAEGKYTAIFHADDIYETEMVARQVAFLEDHPEAGAVFTEASLIDEFGDRFGELRLPRDVAAKDALYDFATMFKAVLRHYNFFICPSVMVRTRVYQQEIRSWRADLFKSSADLDLWLRILQRHPVGYLREELMRYRISSSQFTARVRLNTERADFFLVVDHYLEKDSVRGLVNSTDLYNYELLDRRDRVMRAVNLFITGFPRRATELLKDVLSWDALTAAFRSRRGAFALAVGVYVKLLAFLRLDTIGRRSLSRLKRATRK